MSNSPIRLNPIRTIGWKYLGTQRFLVDRKSEMFIDLSDYALRVEMAEWCERSITPTWFGSRAWNCDQTRYRFEFSRHEDAMGFYLRFNGAQS